MRAALICLVGCGTAPAPPRPAPVPFGLSSPDVGADGRLAASTGCGPRSRSPALSWSDLPEGTESIAVVISSPGDSGERVHWTAWDIDPETGGLSAGVRSTESPPLQGVTDGGRVGWSPVCGVGEDAPVTIDAVALDGAPLPPPSVTAAALRARLAPHLIGLGRIQARPPAPPGGQP